MLASSKEPSSRFFHVVTDNVDAGVGQGNCQDGYMLDEDTLQSCIDIGQYVLKVHMCMPLFWSMNVTSILYIYKYIYI
jgi:hypothetical protein